jgi:hypothetical protein
MLAQLPDGAIGVSVPQGVCSGQTWLVIDAQRGN